jgi:proteasome lid subunit RPN8/RPN11
VSLDDLLDRATKEPQAFGANSRVRFVLPRFRPGSRLPSATSRVTFLQRTPDLAPEGGSHGSRIDVTERQCIDAVPELSYCLNSGARITVTISGHLCRSLIECCQESNFRGREVGGVVVGYQCEQRGGKQDHALVATDLIPIQSSDSSSTHIGFTDRAWVHAERELRARFVPEGKRRLGWYHTHPVQGIFFSTRDQIAHSIFAEAYQFALVADPRRMEAGLFYRSFHCDQKVAGPIRFPLTQGKE